MRERGGPFHFKTPYRDGTTHIILQPLDFIARLVALVPKPRVNLTRYHDVITPNNGFRNYVTEVGYYKKFQESGHSKR